MSTFHLYNFLLFLEEQEKKKNIYIYNSIHLYTQHQLIHWPTIKDVMTICNNKRLQKYHKIWQKQTEIILSRSNTWLR